jgi:Xaa-Pro aminopeptidase
VYTAQLVALSVAKAGALTRTVDESARFVLTKAGHGEYFTHRLGHGEASRFSIHACSYKQSRIGIGLEVHEAPYLRGGSLDVIQTGHAFSDEPGVYMEGKVHSLLLFCIFTNYAVCYR